MADENNISICHFAFQSLLYLINELRFNASKGFFWQLTILMMTVLILSLYTEKVI